MYDINEKFCATKGNSEKEFILKNSIAFPPTSIFFQYLKKPLISNIINILCEMYGRYKFIRSKPISRSYFQYLRPHSYF